jgi:predicted acyltransferase
VKVAAHHLESLDVFRGLTVAAMILVNNPGDWTAVFPQLVHAYWTGCTFADLVFPWFIFMMGVALPFAFARRRQRGHGSPQIYRRIARRVVLLIALGLVLNAVAAWPAVFPLRFPGVLQRIALSYLIAAVVVLQFDVRGWAAVATALLLGHWALLVLVPFAGHAAGTMTPDQNVARFVDTQLLGRHLLLIPIDPEGLLGTLSSAATALLGAVVGHLLQQPVGAAGRIRRLIIGGAFAVITAIAWSRFLPISKPLWTGSFALLTSGLGTLLLAALYGVIDVRGLHRWWRPFLWLGVNPLAIYFLSEVVGHLQVGVKAWLYWTVLTPAMPNRMAWASLIFAIGFVGVWIAVAGVMYRRRIRIQV